MLYLTISAPLHTQEHDLGPHPTDNDGFTSGSRPQGCLPIAIRRAFMGIGLTVRARHSLVLLLHFAIFDCRESGLCCRRRRYTSDKLSLGDTCDIDNNRSEINSRQSILCMQGDVPLHASTREECSLLECAGRQIDGDSF